MTIMRLQKYMSQAGICSRRKAEEYIKLGQVFINDKVAELGQSIDSETDSVRLGSQAQMKQQEFVYYVYNKPRGIETTCAQKGGSSIIDVIDIPERVFPVGRLDKESTGLIVLSNDGRMTNYLTHPRYGHEKEYVVETFGSLGDEQLESMRHGVDIEGYVTKDCHVERIAAGKFSIVLTEGKNRQIRRMVESVGSKVKKLKRIRVENLKLGTLVEGEYRKFKNSEKDQLFKKLGIK
ncbi:rRNA pseudouridine synthase [Candidatus Gracilibacteria bacterium]|nr:rRNA pseudouridine synthase [Candidatus Gracilibacteria bacterium]